MRSAPSRRITSPLSIVLPQMCSASAAYSVGPAEPLRKRDAGGEAVLRGLRQAGQHRRREHTRRDRRHADAVVRQLARRGQRQADNAALGSAVGSLANLPVISGNRSGQEDHPALAIVERIEPNHIGRSEAEQVEAADQVDRDNPLKLLKRHRLAVAVDDASRAADPGAIDDDARRPVPVACRRDGTFGGFGVGHIAGKAKPAELFGSRLGRDTIDVKERDLGPGRYQRHRGGAAQS